MTPQDCAQLYFAIAQAARGPFFRGGIARTLNPLSDTKQSTHAWRSRLSACAHIQGPA
jgi:hypothetical protein